MITADLGVIYTQHQSGLGLVRIVPGTGMGLVDRSCRERFISDLIFYWFLAILPVRRKYGFRYMADIMHPFALIPTLFVPIEAILGWIGLRT